VGHHLEQRRLSRLRAGDAAVERGAQLVGTLDPLGVAAQRLAHARVIAAQPVGGVTLDGVACRFERSDFARFDYILSLDPRVLDTLLRLARTADERDRVHNFRAFDPGSPPDAPVPDPYYGDADGFDEVFDICEAGCRGLLAEVRDRLGAAS